MKYEKTVTGIFVDRPNRFIAHVQIENQLQTVHVKNTGRCKELLLPGSTVILEDFRNRPGLSKPKNSPSEIYSSTFIVPVIIPIQQLY